MTLFFHVIIAILSMAVVFSISGAIVLGIFWAIGNIGSWIGRLTARRIDWDRVGNFVIPALVLLVMGGFALYIVGVFTYAAGRMWGFW